MTTRLKKKLGDLGVDTSSRKANENFCLIGTPLPPLEKSKDTGEFVPLWKQDVRDEKGRRRLHGAFTGGFSAGYFNSVGSKEGWTPATFTSSRNDRAKKPAYRPEDFMDEEDLQDLKDNLKIVDKTEEMDFLGGTQAALGDDDDSKDPITRTLEASLLPAPKDSIGAKILKKMGWRLGQGIGPRISLREREQQDAQAYEATTGRKFSGSTLDIADDDEEASRHTYAPRDTPILAVKRKDNSHGLGYTSGLTLNESLGGASTSATGTGPKLAGGFGLGALNDADEDDLDVYDHHPQSSRSRVAYDHINGDDDDMVVIGGKSDKKSSSTRLQSASQSQYFRDGRPTLAGFVLDDRAVAEDRWFPLPDIPAGWKPDPKRVWAADKENRVAPPPEVQTHGQWKAARKSADQRGAILGEIPLQGAPKSIFDYMSQKDRERIKGIASGLAAHAARGGEPSAPTPAPPPVQLTKLEPHIAQAALRGFQPFTTDPVKQRRYTLYLESQANQDGSAPVLKRLPQQSLDEFTKEQEDYAKAASLFKPMSGAMAGRFTSAAVVDFGPKIIEGLHQPSEAEMAAKEEQRRKEEEDKISPKAHAAKMGMYGPLTREKTAWQPAKLLCKRFGVKEPEVEGPAEPTSAPGPSQAGPSFPPAEPEGSVAVDAQDDTAPVQRTGPRDLANIGLGEDETQGQDTLTYERPSMDIFKAIFASDDEDSDDEDKPDGGEGTSSLAVETTQGTGTGFTSATKILEDDAPIDINTFKPTFIPRDGKGKRSRDDEKSKDRKEKKEKKRKEKKGLLVSFEMEEDAVDGDDATSELRQPKDRPKKKKRKDKEAGEDENEGAMFTKPPVVDPPSEVPSVDPVIDPDASVDEGRRGRKRAIDFM